MMAPDLPDDVWREVVETPSLDRGDLHNLSLANRRMGRLVVPVLFCCLEFRVLRGEFNYLVATLIRANMRARFLFNSPELLRHTRVFKVWGDHETLSWIPNYFALHEDSGDSSSRVDAEKLLTVTYDAIFCLISRMLGLRELLIHDIVITPLYYTAISSRPLLTTLRVLRQTHFPYIMHITPALPHALRLREFDYGCDHLTIHNQPSLFLTDILDHCVLGLEKLTMSSTLLPLVVARIASHHTLSLRSLTVRDRLDKGLVAVFFKVLRACPQLQHLEICHEGFPDVEPSHYLLPLSLPNLSTIKGTPRLLQLVTGGTNIVEISMIGTLHIEEQPLTQVILSSPTHLRELTMQDVLLTSQTAHELLTFIQSLAVFRNLESLTIEYDSSWEGDPESQVYLTWRDQVSAEESHSTIQVLLDQLVCLRFLKIDSEYVEGYNTGCPIAKPGEPADRGHPSLEGIYVDFICGMWSWDSRTGWEERDWAVQ